jgi:hypothetical protein
MIGRIKLKNGLPGACDIAMHSGDWIAIHRRGHVQLPGCAVTPRLPQ